MKYQPLAADLAGQYNGAKEVQVVPIVVGALGTLCKLGANLEKTGWFKKGKEIGNLCGTMQREVLCKAVQIVKRHLAMSITT